MGKNQNDKNLGEQIRKTVDEVLASGNFEKLNSAILNTVSEALEETKKQLDKISVKAEETVAKSKQTASEKKEKNVKVSSEPKYHPAPAPKAKLQKVGNVSGVLLQVFGGIGTGVFGILFIIFFMGLILGKDLAGLMICMGALAGISLTLILGGIEKRARLKRAERYIQVMQGKSYMNLSDLALLTNTSQRFVRKDIKKMIRLGIFPEGHLDQKEQCLILNDIAYREYLRLEKCRLALIEEEKEEVKEISQDIQQTELDLLIEEGSQCIAKLRKLNDAIEGEVISQKLFQLENLLKEIFEQLKSHPEQMPQMHKFMDYYLPTTLKLVTAYEEFDRVSVPGQDILSAKTEIEKTLDTINMAFAEFLNKLFRDRAFDATTDAQVLKTMFEREGLTQESAFMQGKENGKKTV